MLGGICWTNQILCHTIMYMPIRKRHDRNKSHSFSGEKDAMSVIKVLNSRAVPGQERPFRAVKARIMGVLDAIRDLFQKMQENPNWHIGEENDEATGTVTSTLAPELSKAFTAVNLKLAKYTTCSIFYPTLENPRKWTVGEAQMDRHWVDEGQSIHAIVRLADQGLLDRLEMCDCGLWYFARFSHQRFCSEECRVRFWESSEDRKEQKRQRARENYQYKKSHSKPNRKGK